MPTREDIARFLDSMPARYARDFDHMVVAQHAAASAARGDRMVSVSRFASQRPRGDALCVIADDRPGLFWMFAEAFVATELDVVAAKAYTRRSRGRPPEAVALFWAKPAAQEREPRRLPADDTARLHARLTEIVRDPSSVSNPSPCPEQGARASGGSTVVRFLEGRSGTLSTLEIEAEDRFGLLRALSRALYEQRAVIESCEIRTEHHRVLDSFSITELDGSPIAPAHRLQIQVAVLSATEAK